MNIYKWSVYYYEESEATSHNYYGLITGANYSEATQNLIDKEFNGDDKNIESIRLKEWGSCVMVVSKDPLNALEKEIAW